MQNQTKKWWVLLGTAIGAFMICIDFTIVNTVLPNIQHDLHATIGQLQWMMAGFGVFFCTFLVTLGRLADIIGRRKIFYISIIGFGITSLGAALVQTAGQLIFFRILQGMFAAGAFPSGFALAAHAFPNYKEQSRALGLYNSILGIGLAVGPVIGGFIVSVVSWRWIFYINIPTILLSFLICYFTVSESKLEEKSTIDWWGFILMTLFVAGLAFAINESPLYGWSSPIILTASIIAIISMIALYFVEKNISQPLIPLHLFTNHLFALSCVLSLILIALVWPFIFMIPLYLHTVLNYETFAIGLLLIPLTIMTVIIPPIASHLYTQHGPNLISSIAFILLFLGLCSEFYFGFNTPIWLIIFSFITYGAAWGIGNGLYGPVSLSSSETRKHAGLVSGAVITILNVGGVFYLSIGVTLFRYLEQKYLYQLLSQSKVKLTETQLKLVHAMLANPETASQYAGEISLNHGQSFVNYFHQAFVYAYHDFILLLVGISVIGLIATLMLLYLIKNKRKHS